MPSDSSDTCTLSPSSDSTERAIRQHTRRQRLAPNLGSHNSYQQYNDEQAHGWWASGCAVATPTKARPSCAETTIPTVQARQRPLQSKQRKTKQTSRHRSSRLPDISLTRNVSSSPAVAVAKETLDLYHQQGTFFSRTMLEQVIPRLEYSLALTHAANAVSSVLRHRFRPASGRGQGLQHYTNALAEIRSNLRSSEALLLAINLLCYYELVTGFDVSVLKHHASGLHSLLLADGDKWSNSTVGRTVLLGTRLLAIEACMAAGKPSPFEEDFWLQHESPSSRPSDAVALSKRAHQILFKLPRLAFNLRKIRAGNTDFDTVCETAALAQRLLRMKDDAAYQGVLRSCQVRETVSDADRHITPSSLHFTDLADFDDFLDYCRARLTITTLFLALPRLIPRFIVPERAQVKQQQIEAADAVLQCWQTCMETQRFAKSMSTTLFPLYGALKQMDSWRGIPVEQVISWLEYKSILAFGHVNGFSGESDLASTWDMYCGGPGENSIYRQWV